MTTATFTKQKLQEAQGGGRPPVTGQRALSRRDRGGRKRARAGKAAGRSHGRRAPGHPASRAARRVRGAGNTCEHRRVPGHKAGSSKVHKVETLEILSARKFN